MSLRWLVPLPGPCPLAPVSPSSHPPGGHIGRPCSCQRGGGAVLGRCGPVSALAAFQVNQFTRVRWPACPSPCSAPSGLFRPRGFQGGGLESRAWVEDPHGTPEPPSASAPPGVSTLLTSCVCWGISGFTIEQHHHPAREPRSFRRHFLCPSGSGQAQQAKNAPGSNSADSERAPFPALASDMHD